MPLSKIQIAILRLLASHRDPESYVGGSTPLNRQALRYSADIDVFHDREERVASAAENDAVTLRDNGFDLVWKRREPAIQTAVIGKEGDSTRLDWVADSDYRFFPTMPDEMFGYLLHPVDLGINKIMAAAGRREVRDIVDAVLVHQTILPLGAIVWAAVDKAPGFTPEGLIAEIRRNSSYPASEWRALKTDAPIDPDTIVRTLRAALEEAEIFVRQMPTEKAGLLFLEADQPVQPDPSRLEVYRTHRARRRGQWPGSSDISSAMLERYRS